MMSYYYTNLTRDYVQTVEGSENWQFDRISNPTATVSLWVNGKYMKSVISELLTPLPHPIFDFLVVQNVSAKPLGKGEAGEFGHILDYPQIQLDVTYSPWDFSYTEDVTMTANMITLPKYMFSWAPGGDGGGSQTRPLADGEEPSRIVRMQKIRHSYGYVTEIPQWVYLGVGCVNSDQIITQQGIYCNPETLLYEGAETSYTETRMGTQGWQLTTNFTYNPNGWNRWFNAVTGKWESLYKTTANRSEVEDEDGNLLPGVIEGEGGSLFHAPFKMYETEALKEWFEAKIDGFNILGTNGNR